MRRDLSVAVDDVQVKLTHFVREHPANVAKVVAFEPVVCVGLHPASECANALGSDGGIRVAVTVDKDAVPITELAMGVSW